MQLPGRSLLQGTPELMQRLMLVLLQVYKPIVEAVSRRLDADFNVTDSIFGAQQPQATVAAIHSYLEGSLNEVSRKGQDT